MTELVQLWEEFEEWHARIYAPKPGQSRISPDFAQFIAWYRDVYSLKNPT